jgi:TolB protein
LFYLKTLGELSLHASGPKGPPLLRNSKPLAVLAYLATAADHAARRDHLAQLLWPDSDAGHARSSLRQALHYITQRVGRPLVRAGDSLIELDVGELDVDLWEFERALAAEDYAHAVELYAGPFVPGLERKAGAELEEWIESQDENLRAGLDVAYTRLVADAMARNWPSTAVEYGRLFVELNPLNEVAQLAYVRALKAAGDQVGALRAYRSYRSLLREALHDVPSEELERAIASVRDEVLRDPTPDPNRAGAGVPRRSSLRRLTVSGLVGAVAATVVLAVGFFALRPSGVTDDPFATLRGTLYAVVGHAPPLRLARVDYRGASARLQVTGRHAEDVPSPDGSVVATHVVAPDGVNLGLLDLATGELIELTTRPQDEAALDWSPDGRFILFRQGELSAAGDDYNWDLRVYDLAAGAAHRLSGLRSPRHERAAWSPRGVEIAFVAGPEGNSDVFVIDADGGHLARLTDDPADDREPAWSPDGERLAFASERSGASDIYIMNRNGSGLRRVTRSPAAEVTPIWLSDRVLAFVRRSEGDAGDLWAVDLQAGEERRLTERGDVRNLARGGGLRDEPGWVERIAIRPVGRAVSPGLHVRLPVELYGPDDREIGSGGARIDWWVDDPAVAAFVEDDLLQVRGSGPLTIVASAGGWRADTLELLSVEPVPGPTTLLLYEDWSRGLQTDRWIRWGEPLPYARPTGGPESGGLFVANGDHHYSSGVVSRQAFAPGNGLTLECWARLPFDGRLYQDFAVGFISGPLPEDSAEWVTVDPTVELRIQGPNDQVGPRASLYVQGTLTPIPFPAAPEEWHLYTLQLEPGGSVSVLSDGRFHWRTAPVLDVASLPSLSVLLGYRSVGVELAHGLLRVYYGTRHLLPQVEPETVRRPTFDY